jgi:hypothetical protein
VQISRECTPSYLSTGISNLLQLAQAEVVLGQLSTYLASWVVSKSQVSIEKKIMGWGWKGGVKSSGKQVCVTEVWMTTITNNRDSEGPRPRSHIQKATYQHAFCLSWLGEILYFSE